MANSVKQIEATADDPDSDEIRVVNMDLYRGVSDRATEHVFEFTDAAGPAFRDYVKQVLDEDTSVTYTVEDDTIRVTHKES